jgi:hypothetical protein
MNGTEVAGLIVAGINTAIAAVAVYFGWQAAKAGREATIAARDAVRLEQEMRADEARERRLRRLLFLQECLVELMDRAGRVADGQPYYLFQHAKARLTSALASVSTEDFPATMRAMSGETPQETLERLDPAFEEVDAAVAHLAVEGDSS